MIKRFWISWACTATDYRPLTFPPNEAICGWWCSGYSSAGRPLLCAVVDAESEQEARQAVFVDWPEAKTYVRGRGWRFFEEQEGDFVPGDRFPASEWMKDRLSRARGATGAGPAPAGGGK